MSMVVISNSVAYTTSSGLHRLFRQTSWRLPAARPCDPTRPTWTSRSTCETLATMNPQYLRGRVVAHVGLTVLALIFAGLVPFGFNLLVARAYGPAVLGGISVVLGLALFLGQVPSTVGIAATKFMAEALGRGDESAARAIFQFLFTLNLGLTALLTGAMVIAAPWIHQALHVPVGAVLLGAALLLVYSLYLFLKSVYYGIQQVGAYVWNEIISDLAFFALLAAVFVVRASSWLLLPFVLNNA